MFANDAERKGQLLASEFFSLLSVCSPLRTPPVCTRVDVAHDTREHVLIAWRVSGEKRGG